MKKNIYLAVLLFLTGCQNELYKNPLDDFQSEQGVYIAAYYKALWKKAKMWKLKGCK